MRIGIANPRPDAVDVLRRAVACLPTTHVAWTAVSGAEAVERCINDVPDLVLMDLAMPGIDGVEATRQISHRVACPVVIVTDSVQDNAARVFEAMACGALDAVDLPAPNHFDLQRAAEALLAKITNVGRLLRHDHARPAAPVFRLLDGPRAETVVAIGAPSGSADAVATLLRGVPVGFRGAIVIVPQSDPQFMLGMAGWLGEQATLPVRVARHGDHLVAGTVLLAGRAEHLVFMPGERLGYADEPTGTHRRPSIDVFFDSLLRHWQGEAVGVLLKGLGRDGLTGLKGMRERGLYTVAEDERRSVWGTPHAAAASDAAVDIVPISRVATHVLKSIGVLGESAAG